MNGSPLNPQEFILFFENVQDNKKNIYKELRKKAGVYVFINNKTNELYVGSSVNLTKRMVSYYYYYNSDKPSQLVIIRAMKKYRLDNFSLGIKEFCASDNQTCLDLEQK
jgi:group I intron endonuclease